MVVNGCVCTGKPFSVVFIAGVFCFFRLDRVLVEAFVLNILVVVVVLMLIWCC